MMPLLAELAGLSLVAFSVGAVLAYVVALRRRRTF